MSHRIVNNVGYKKVYPMSLHEDSSFCHYCGRTARPTLRLEWDHVPALNVKIPEGCSEIRKTLIRSCNECNRMASDIPHMDYLERHFWLKGAYLRKYKWLLLNDGVLNDKQGTSGFLQSYLVNAEVLYEELLQGIGFGILSIEEIESPILNLKTKSNRKLSNVIFDYLHYPLIKDDEDDDIKLIRDVTVIKALKSYCSVNEFIEFIYLESHVQSDILTIEGYYNWKQCHPSRYVLLEHPNNPEKYYKLSWVSIIDKVYDQYIEKGFNEQYCPLGKFVSVIKPYNLTIFTTKGYQKWHKANIKELYVHSLPKHPTKAYKKSWFILNEMIQSVNNSPCNKQNEITSKIMQIENPHSMLPKYCSVNEFIVFLKDTDIKVQSAYAKYIRKHTSQVTNLKLPSDPVLLYQMTWNELIECCNQAVKFDIYKLSEPIDTAIQYVKELRLKN